MLLVDDYIGVNRGYLGSFHSRSELRDFYQIDCDLDIDPPYDYPDTIKEQFVDILKSQSGRGQAAILRAAMREFYQPGFTSEHPSKQDKLYDRLEKVAERLETQSEMVNDLTLSSSPEAVKLALEEAATSIRRGNVSSAVDRTHTAVHGYLKHLCTESGIALGNRVEVTKVFKLLRTNHPALKHQESWPSEVDKTLRGLATALDAINTLRNHASLAHSSSNLLAEAEATLAVNAARSILHYINDKLQEYNDAKDRQAQKIWTDDIPF